MLTNEDVERALVVMAHPDDVDFGAAGTVAGWTEAGTAVTYCIATDGEAGGVTRTGSAADMAALRRKEQTRAAEQVSVHDVRFLGYPDGRLMADFELRRDLTRVIRQVRPQRMLIPSPERDWERIAASHPDHLAAGEAAINAIYPDARNPHAYPELLAEEGLPAWTVPEVWLAHGRTPNRWVDITEQVERKLAALAAHQSQIEDMAAIENMLREWLAQTAADGGLPRGRLAESFQAVSTG